MATSMDINSEMALIRSGSGSQASLNPATFIEVTRWRALNEADRLAYTFLGSGQEVKGRLTYGEIDRRARALAALLQSYRAKGERVLLLYPPGLDYVVAFLGCLYADSVAVPAYPPRVSRGLPRLQAIVADAQASLALTTGPSLSMIEPMMAHSPDLKTLRWIATDNIEEDLEQYWQPPDIDGDTLAFLQYTSGSTGTPKGVMVSHRNLLHNSAMLACSFEYTSESRCVSWLPIYHDMGLVGGVLQPLYGGFPCVLMSPMTFLQDPFQWLQTISLYKATLSGGPNFAYDLCVRKIGPEQKAELDLSNWSVAFNGAEPIRPETLERFIAAFAPCGFRREAFFNCYGLAEATLLVSGGPKSEPPAYRSIQSDGLDNRRFVDTPLADNHARLIASSGRVLPDGKIVVVNPESKMECEPGEIGEVWVSSPSIARGYWNKPKETEETFRARLSGTDEGPFLRTGDLGFLHDGELYVAGRLKDLIIIRGLNHYPQDIELSVERSHPALRPGCGAAFSVQASGDERLVIVHEVQRHHGATPDEIFASIRKAVAEEHELEVHAITLIKAGSIPKTSSGKLQRRLCRKNFSADALEVAAQWRAGDKPEFETSAQALPSPDHTPEAISDWLVSLVSTRLAVPLDEMDVNEPVGSYGLDSLITIELIHKIETGLGIKLPNASLLQDTSIAQLTANVIAQLKGPPTKPLVAARDDSVKDHPLSLGQQAMWFLQILTPESTAYNIADAVRIKADLDVAALRRAFQAIVDRHPSLRTTFSSVRGGPLQKVHDHMEVCFKEEDASTWTGQFLDKYLVEEANRPFDLEHDPPLRIHLLKRLAREYVLLLVAHHIVTDFWSLGVLVHELGILYSAEAGGSSVALVPLRLSYTDYAMWQAEMLSSDEGERLWSFWQKQLAGDLPVLNLKTDRPRPAVQTYRGASHPFKLNAEQTRGLKALSRKHGVTLYTVLLAAFQSLFNRYTAQEDILVGTLAAGRNRAELSGLIGYLVNPIVLRADFSDNPTFKTFLGRTRQTILAALEHQEYPFPLLVERLQPVRDTSRSPLFQVMFVLMKSHLLDEEGLASFALGETGAQMNLGSLTLESLALEQRVSQFDLTLVIAAVEDGLGASLQYNTDLFDAATISRMAGHFQTLINGILKDAGQRISDLPLLSEAEQGLLAETNATQADYPTEACIQQVFEWQATHQPEAVALVFKGDHLSYGKLNRQANRLAHHLRAKGVGPGVLVGVRAERSLEMMVGLLAILKAGGAYVPMDPTYPKERLAFMLEDTRVPVLLTQQRLVKSLPDTEAEIICLDTDLALLEAEESNPDIEISPDDLAYVIYTSGSTGKPKGVMVTHRNVINFFTGMDQQVGCDATDTLLAVTSISFDISVLELFWTLSRGAKVVLLDEQAATGVYLKPKQETENREMQFSLFYFASDQAGAQGDKYRLLFEAAKFADQHGFSTIWTPERHFHAFGGLYPNPSVTSAALAALTERIRIHAGSVVLPLHNPIRVAEEWALVDNFSNGRVGIAFASGWHADDFVFSPESYADRKEVMYRGIETVKKLWRGEPVEVKGGAGNQLEVKILPRPIQPELPVWITAAGTAETFIKAGQIGANILTHLLGQSLEEVKEKIRIYRKALADHGHDSNSGHVTLMLHTFVGEDLNAIEEIVRAPFTNYLRSSVGLIAGFIKSLNLPLDLGSLSPKDLDDLLAFAFSRYFNTSALFGTPASCEPMIDQLKTIGVDEVACLIDFGVDVDSVLASLHSLNRLRELANDKQSGDYFLPAQATRHGVTLMQCTPSMMRMLMLNPAIKDSLTSLRALMLGGEALPAALAQQVKETWPGRLLNMYGPTETTIWSAVHEVKEVGDNVAIGRPIANTQIYILDDNLQQTPVGIDGQLYIGGVGLARGYFNRPDLAAERFIPSPFGQEPGARLYATGDMARFLADGTVEFLGRVDHQVKIRGFRIELGEIESLLADHPAVREAVVVARDGGAEDKLLIAYLVMEKDQPPNTKQLRAYLKEKLPAYMLPASFVPVDVLPLTSNGKVDRKTLAAMEVSRPEARHKHIAPKSSIEKEIAAVWQQVLKMDGVGIHDNFFDLGGHSLLMAQVHSRLQEIFKKDLPLIKLLEHPTVSSLAKYLGEEQKEPVSFDQNLDRAKKQREALKRRRPDPRARYKTI
jgi:natural product biosynthesis luciferase-like monooxygenase protein